MKVSHVTLQAEHVTSVAELAAVSADRDAARRELSDLTSEAAQEKKDLTEHIASLEAGGSKALQEHCQYNTKL